MFNSITANGLTLPGFMICTGSALILGLLLALCFSFRAHFSKSFLMTLALLPAIVQVVIMMVSGSIGAGVAVAGTFSMVRFRSEPGTARQILALFFATALGICLGMGCVLLAVLFFVVTILFYLLLSAIPFGEAVGDQRELRISIPENLNYDDLFEDLFETYTRTHTLTRVRTTNMGTLYELRYTVILKQDAQLKAFMDEIRTRNGNLTVSCSILGTESNM